MGSSILIEKKGKISIIKLNLPEKLNPLESGMREDLKSALSQFRDDTESNVAVLTGQGRAFSAGGNLSEMVKGMSAVRAVAHYQSADEITLLIATIPKPIIAAVNGVAAGAGFSLVLACDLVIASTESSFMQAFTKVGLIPDMGSLYFLPRVVGMHRAKELIWTARKINAEQAQQMGIVNEIVERENLETRVLELANTIANGPAFTIGMVKVLLLRSLESSLQDMLQYEVLGQSLCRQTEDHMEGVKSFLEKRTPVFCGK
jgi:2-(1,2-epoxy-1,2-dihydrophenyl)acetyl-CoA isomerase